MKRLVALIIMVGMVASISILWAANEQTESREHTVGALLVITNQSRVNWHYKAIAVDYQPDTGFTNVFQLFRVRGTTSNNVFTGNHTNITDAIGLPDGAIIFERDDLTVILNSQAGLTNQVILDQKF